MTVKIPNFSESIVDESGKASRNWFNFWKTLPLTPGQLRGTTTNDDAAAGNVGEYVNSEVVQGAAVILASAISKNITTISLSPGDWRVWFNGRYFPDNNTSITGAQISLSTASATLQDTPNSRTAFLTMPQAGMVGAGFALASLVVGPARFSVTTTTIVYAVANATFAVGALRVYGHLQAERRR